MDKKKYIIKFKWIFWWYLVINWYKGNNLIILINFENVNILLSPDNIIDLLRELS